MGFGKSVLFLFVCFPVRNASVGLENLECATVWCLGDSQQMNWEC